MTHYNSRKVTLFFFNWYLGGVDYVWIVDRKMKMGVLYTVYARDARASVEADARATRRPLAPTTRSVVDSVGPSVVDRVVRVVTTRDLQSFIRVASARALVRDALRATRQLSDADARRAVTAEIVRYAREAPRPIAEASKDEGARALADAKRRVRELEEMILMAK